MTLRMFQREGENPEDNLRTSMSSVIWHKGSSTDFPGFMPKGLNNIFQNAIDNPAIEMMDQYFAFKCIFIIALYIQSSSLKNNTNFSIKGFFIVEPLWLKKQYFCYFCQKGSTTFFKMPFTIQLYR